MILNLTDEETEFLTHIIMEFLDSPNLNDSNAYMAGVLLGKSMGLKEAINEG